MLYIIYYLLLIILQNKMYGGVFEKIVMSKKKFCSAGKNCRMLGKNPMCWEKIVMCRKKFF